MEDEDYIEELTKHLSWVEKEIERIAPKKEPG